MAARKKVPRKKKTTARKKAPRQTARRVTATDAETKQRIDKTARRVHSVIQKGNRPDLALPVRALSNVSYKDSVGYLEIGKQRKARNHSYSTRM